GYCPNGKSEWIAATKRFHEKHDKVFAKYLQQRSPHLYRQGVWIFGDWDKALRAAGFDPKRMRLRAFWDQDRIIEEIRDMRDKNLPLYANYVMKITQTCSLARYAVSIPGTRHWSLRESIRNRLRLAFTKAVPTYYEHCAMSYKMGQRLI